MSNHEKQIKNNLWNAGADLSLLGARIFGLIDLGRFDAALTESKNAIKLSTDLHTVLEALTKELAKKGPPS